MGDETRGSMSEVDIYGLLIKLDGRMEELAKDVAKLSHVILEGNGTPPMTVKVATLETRVNLIEGEKKEAKIPKHVWLTVMASTITAIVAIVISIKGL